MNLFPYQLEGAKFLASKSKAILADEMGLGKSAQAIRACDLIEAKRVLVLAPAAARINWLREFERFSTLPRKFTLITKRKTDRLEDSVVCSYDLADTMPDTQTFDVLILDEAHFLKSPDTKRTRAVFGKNGLVHRVKRVWCLTGTPAPNHPGELWPMLFTFGVTTLAHSTFIKKFCTYYIFDRRLQVTGSKVHMLPELREAMRPIMLRRMKDEVMKQLPPIAYQEITVEPGLVDLEIESSFAHWFFPHNRGKALSEKLDRQKVIMEAAFKELNVYSATGSQTMSALAESVSTLRRFTGLQKVEPVADLVASELLVDAYDKIVIFAIHRDVIEGLRVRLRTFHPVTLYGGTPGEVRQVNIDKFQRNPKYRVFIGNIHAAGTAITLTAAHHVLFIEQSWVPGDNAQAAMRCHRIGQTKPVTVRFVSIADSIDEKVSHALKRKTSELTTLFRNERDRIRDDQK